jgi:hypothetical protein
MVFQLVQLIYWLALSTWFGGILFLAIAAPVIFRTVRESHAVLPTVLSVNLENQHGTLLAGTIVGNLLAQLTRVQLFCAAILGLMMIAQVFIIDLSGSNGTAMIIRAALLFAAAALAGYDRYFIWPKIMRYRDEYVGNADDPEIANPAKEKFDAEHHLSVNLMMGILCLLAGLILFSAAIIPRATAVALPMHHP